MMMNFKTITTNEVAKQREGPSLSHGDDDRKDEVK